MLCTVWQYSSSLRKLALFIKIISLQSLCTGQSIITIISMIPNRPPTDLEQLRDEGYSHFCEKVKEWLDMHHLNEQSCSVAAPEGCLREHSYGQSLDPLEQETQLSLVKVEEEEKERDVHGVLKQVQRMSKVNRANRLHEIDLDASIQQAPEEEKTSSDREGNVEQQPAKEQTNEPEHSFREKSPIRWLQQFEDSEDEAEPQILIYRSDVSSKASEDKDKNDDCQQDDYLPLPVSQEKSYNYYDPHQLAEVSGEPDKDPSHQEEQQHERIKMIEQPGKGGLNIVYEESDLLVMERSNEYFFKEFGRKIKILQVKRQGEYVEYEWDFGKQSHWMTLTFCLDKGLPLFLQQDPEYQGVTKECYNREQRRKGQKLYGFSPGYFIRRLKRTFQKQVGKIVQDFNSRDNRVKQEILEPPSPPIDLTEDSDEEQFRLLRPSVSTVSRGRKRFNTPRPRKRNKPTTVNNFYFMKNESSIEQLRKISLIMRESAQANEL